MAGDEQLLPTNQSREDEDASRRHPYFPLYVADIVSDGKVEAMTTEEVGAYFLLLCKAWRERPCGTIPADDFTLARWTRLSARRWKAVRQRVLAPFYLEDGRWHQKRMKEEYQKLVARSESGRKAAQRRWNKQRSEDANASESQCDGNANASESQCDGNANASESQCEPHTRAFEYEYEYETKRETIPARDGGVGEGGGDKPRSFRITDPIPGNLYVPEFLAVWIEWKTYHAQRGRPLVPTTVRLQLAEMERMGVGRAIAAMKNSMKNFWVKLVEPETEKPKGGNRNDGRRYRYNPDRDGGNSPREDPGETQGP